ncbi:transporter substrate-binding domain-containing protein [Bacillus sp. SL00103]
MHSRKNSDLTAKFNKSLKEMQDNGELDKLIKKWFADKKISQEKDQRHLRKFSRKRWKSSTHVELFSCFIFDFEVKA